MNGRSIEQGEWSKEGESWETTDQGVLERTANFQSLQNIKGIGLNEAVQGDAQGASNMARPRTAITGRKSTLEISH